MSGKDFLFVWWEGGGNVPPLVAIVRRLVSLGHRVRVLSDPCNRDEFTQAGAEFVSYTRAPKRRTKRPEDDYVRDWEARNPLQLVRIVMERSLVGPALGVAQDTLEEIERRRPDALGVMDFTFGGLLAAEKARIPVAIIAPHILLRPAPGVPPFGPGFMPARGVAGRLRDRLVAAISNRSFQTGLPSMNAHRAVLGLPPVRSLWEMMDRADRDLILTSPSFDFVASPPPHNVRYAGPVLDDPVWVSDWVNPWPEAHPDPLVLVGLSSTFQNQGGLVQRILDAVSSMHVRAVVTLGPALEPAQFSAPLNARIFVSAPHSKVLAHSSAMITHAGHGSVIRGLASGVPLLCIPMGRDQNDVAARVVHRGAGLQLKVGAGPDRIRAALGRLIHEPHFRQSAVALGEAIRRDAANSTVVDELVQVADTRHGCGPDGDAAVR